MYGSSPLLVFLAAIRRLDFQCGLKYVWETDGGWRVSVACTPLARTGAHLDASSWWEEYTIESEMWLHRHRNHWMKPGRQYDLFSWSVNFETNKYNRTAKYSLVEASSIAVLNHILYHLFLRIIAVKTIYRAEFVAALIRCWFIGHNAQLVNRSTSFESLFKLDNLSNTSWLACSAFVTLTRKPHT